MYPGRPELVFVIADVLVGPVAGQNIGNRCPADRRFESGRGGDEIICRHSTVTPPAYYQPLRVGDTTCNGVIHCRKIILHIDSAPGGVDAHRVVRSTPSGTARIWHNDRISIGREKLLLEI